MKNLIKKVKKLDNLLPEPKYDGSWMSRDANIAFLVSLGMGPWKEKRRCEIQKAAIDWFIICNFTDIRDVSSFESWAKNKVYPYEWQNNFLFKMGHSLKKTKDLFPAICINWTSSKCWEDSLKDLFKRCGTKKGGSKVLWMFARDYLNIPAFPIDRCIRRTLAKYSLPQNSWSMTELCLKAEVNPNILNRKIFGGTNPDWN